MQIFPESSSSRQTEQSLQSCAEYRDFAAAVEQGDHFEILNQVYGIEPVLALVEDRKSEIPTAGWLVRAYITPGYQGTINIFKYSEGDLFFGKVCKPLHNPDREVYSICCLNASKEYMLAYDNPNPIPEHLNPPRWPVLESFLERCSLDETDEADYICLENGGRLFYSDNPSYLYCDQRLYYGFYRTAVSLQIEDSLTSVNRVVSGIEELGAVLMNLGAGMGLNENDTRSLIMTAGQKISRPD